MGAGIRKSKRELPEEGSIPSGNTPSYPRTRNSRNLQTKQLTTGIAVLVGLLFIVAAVLYFTQSAQALPGFLPGHAMSGTAEAMTHHTKHGILALALAVCSFVAARFFWGPATDKVA